ncbi:MAG TPA: hypothetical protein ENJ77_01105 [Candidatus Moranbacteria bacterium]|nr:hypothetical protein [Candidatus Moranbacteria bacterium]
MIETESYWTTSSLTLLVETGKKAGLSRQMWMAALWLTLIAADEKIDCFVASNNAYRRDRGENIRRKFKK